MRKLPIALFLVALAAQAQTNHDVRWYLAHPRERADAVDACHNDAELGQMPNCQNALEANEQYGLAQMIANSTRGAGWADELRDPQRWAKRSVQERRNVIAICAAHPPFYSPEECEAARQGETIATQ
jgi:hypothetical protein